MITGSTLLSALNPADRAMLSEKCEERNYEAGQILYEPGDHVDYAYFPADSSIATFLVPIDDGRAIETAIIGREGAIGGIVSRGRLPAYARSSVMHGGRFYRIHVEDLEEVKSGHPNISNLFSRYSDCLIAQVFQSVACNAAHLLEQRTARWISAAAKRTAGNEVAITQEQLASILGVGRSYTSRVIQRFKKAGYLETRRGGFIIHDLEGLEGEACDCNRSIAKHYETVFQELSALD